MAGFSIEEAAFTGFGLVREHPRSLAVWAVLSLALSFIIITIFVGVAGPVVTVMQSLSISASRDPAVVFPLLGRLVPLYITVIPVSLVFYGVICSAMNRAVLRPSEYRFGYLALGEDELRQIGLLFLTCLLFTATYILLLIGFSIVGALVSGLTHASPVLLGVMSVLLALGVMTWIAVRLSLASALTFERQRLTLFGSWAVTKGRFWPVLGTYLLVFALASVIAILTWFVTFAIVAVAVGGDLTKALAPPDLQSLRHYFTATQLMQLVLGAGVSALMWPVILTPPAAILRQINMSGAGILANRGAR